MSLTRSKHFMASATATTTNDSPPKRRKPQLGFSRLARRILLANLAGLIVLVIGVLVLDDMRQGLIDARIANLRAQAELIAGVLEETATFGAPTPQMDVERARIVMNGLFLNPNAARVELFNDQGELVTDSNVLRDEVRVNPLSPLQGTKSLRGRMSDWVDHVESFITRINPFSHKRKLAHRTLHEEVATALLGAPVAGERVDDNGDRVVSVSVPVQHVVAVLGVVTVESSDVDAIIAAERRALFPFIFVAIAVTLVSAITLTFFIARPIRQLAIAADRIRRGGARRMHIPMLASRKDEIGDLSRSLEAMTSALDDRLDAIESFAADVAHEIKNPLTSMHSAVETLPHAKKAQDRERLLAVLKSDVSRLDRLITDISASSRLDADLARARAEPIDLNLFLGDIVGAYEKVAANEPVQVELVKAPHAPDLVYGSEDALARVLRNLIDNAISFSPEGGLVTVRISRVSQHDVPYARIDVEDQGPGIPAENLESIFRRFYTDRPKGAKFGAHSGLGLSIARQIILAHKGRITAENLPGKSPGDPPGGARFVVTLPLDPGL